jgi:hypothetical protein
MTGSAADPGEPALHAAGARTITVPGAGHNVMLDALVAPDAPGAPDAPVAALAD